MDMQRLNERLERLESQIRLRKLAAFAVCGCAGVLLVLGQAAPQAKSITATSVVLVDADGKIRGEMGVSFTDKLPSLSFRDEEGRKHWEVPPPKKDER